MACGQMYEVMQRSPSTHLQTLSMLTPTLQDTSGPYFMGLNNHYPHFKGGTMTLEDKRLAEGPMKEVVKEVELDLLS